jgi:hypothetical protein
MATSLHDWMTSGVKCRGRGVAAEMVWTPASSRIVRGRHAAGKGTFLRRGSLFAWAGLLLALLATSAHAERRLAFVAGVNTYSNLPANM